MNGARLPTIGLRSLVDLKKTQRLEDYPIISKLALAWFDQPECAKTAEDFSWAADNLFTLPELRLFFEEQPGALPESNTLEIETEIDLQSAGSVGLGIKSGNQAPQLSVGFNGLELRVLDVKPPLTLAKGDRKLKLRIFIDRSVLEVFANETACVTKIISPLEAHAALEIRADGGKASAKRIQAWPIKTIW